MLQDEEVKHSTFAETVDELLTQEAPSWDGLRAAIDSALVEHFPKQREQKTFHMDSVWEQRRS